MLFIKKESIIYSDRWWGYCNLNEFGYIHRKVNHPENFVDQETRCHKNTIEGNWFDLKRGVPISLRRRKYIKACLLRYIFWEIIKMEDLVC